MALGRESVTTSPKSPSHLRLVIDRLRRSASAVSGAILVDEWTANGTIVEGDILYAQADGVAGLADASAIGTGRVIGIARSGGTTGDPIVVQTAGMVEFSGWSLTANAMQFLSTTAGDITETAPTATGEVVTAVGVAVSTTQLVLLLSPPILL